MMIHRVKRSDSGGAGGAGGVVVVLAGDWSFLLPSPA
jgi:hypothetical protein